MRLNSFFRIFPALLLATSSASAEDRTSTDVTSLPAVEVVADNEPEGFIAQESRTATKLNTEIMETPRSVSVVTEERFTDQGANSVQEALMYSAGVYGGPYGYDTRGDWAIIRGAEAVEFVNGLKSLFGYYNTVRRNPYTLSSIEILKGPFSTLYGQGSVGGIMNLVSKTPTKDSRRDVYVEYGSFDRKEIGTDMGTKLNEEGTLLFRAVGVYRDSHTQVDSVEDDTGVITPSFTYMPTDKTKFTLITNFQDNSSGTSSQFLPWAGTILSGPSSQLDSGVFLSEPGWDRYDTTSYSATSIVEHRFDDVWSIDARARISTSSSAYYSMWPDFPPTFLEDGRSLSRTVYIAHKNAEGLTSDVRVKADFEMPYIKHNSAVGVDYQNYVLNEDSYYGYGEGGTIDAYNPVYGNIPPDSATPLSPAPENTTLQTGVYFLDQMKIMDKLLLSLGLRNDWADSKTDDGEPGQDDKVFTKNFGIMYPLEIGIAPYASYAESFTPVIGLNSGGDAFKPVRGEQYEVGLKYQPPKTPSIFSVAAYDLTEKNRSTSDPANPLNMVQIGEVRVKGVEFENQFVFGDIEGVANYSILTNEITKSNDGDEGAHIATVPNKLASGWLSYRPHQLPGFKVGAGIRYVDPTWDGKDVQKNPAYTLYDAMIGYDYGQWGVILNGQNLEDQIYTATCLNRGDCFMGARRTFALNVLYRF